MNAPPSGLDLGSCLRQRRDSILGRWEAAARAAVAPAQGLAPATLRGALPDLLDSLAAALGGAAAANLDACASQSAEHGCQRAALSGYGLDDVLVECRLLRDAIVAELRGAASGGRDAATAVHVALDRATVTAAAAFLRCHDPDGQMVAAAAARAIARAAVAVRDVETQRARREDFVVALCHDLLQPLAAARLAAQALSLRAADPAAASLGVAVARNVARAARMVANLLDANRLAAGGPLPLAVAPCDLRALAADVLADVAAVHGDRFVLAAPAAVAGVWSADGLRRVLENLVGNAVKYGAPDAPVRVTLAATDDAVTLAVHNDGPPIPAAAQAGLFERFRQATSAGGAGGWGLGLFVVRGLVTAHGGDVTLESAPGVGTTFTVHLARDARPFQAPEAG